MTGNQERSAPRRARHRTGLVLIAAYKFLTALFFVALGVGALHLMHRDVDDELAQLAAELRFNPESRFVNFVLDKALLLNDPILRRIGVAAFCYAGLGILEGIGLYLERAWGEYLTLIITASFIPFEIHELMRRLTWFRTGLFVVNVIVLIYLLKVVYESGRRSRETAAQPS